MRTSPISAMPEDKPADQNPAAREPAQPRRTPGTDMQAEDSGTPDSGQPEGRGTPAESAMKQTSKTEDEPGSRG